MSLSFAKLAAVKAADSLHAPSTSYWHLLHCCLLVLRKHTQGKKTTGMIPVSLTNEFLNIQKKMPIVMGAVLLNCNCAAAPVGRVVYLALIHLCQTLLCSKSPGGDRGTGSSPQNIKTIQQNRKSYEQSLLFRHLTNMQLHSLLTPAYGFKSWSSNHWFGAIKLMNISFALLIKMIFLFRMRTWINKSLAGASPPVCSTSLAGLKEPVVDQDRKV